MTFLLPEHLVDSDLGRKAGVSAQSQVLNLEKEKGHFHDNNAAKSNVGQAAMESRQTPVKSTDTEIQQMKGTLPEGFFKNEEIKDEKKKITRKVKDKEIKQRIP